MGYYGDWLGESKRYPVADNVNTTSKKEPITRDTLKKNAETEMLKCVEEGKNIVFMEPLVDIKMKQLMALAGDKEIFGKLLIKEEYGYLTVKDILVPEQSITGSTFNADKEDIGKFMYSLFFKNNDPSTKIRRSQEEVEAITKNLSGHFHSHNSISSSTIPSPSGVDTDDMADQVEGRDYWIEIIGTMAGYSGRLIVNTPINKVWGNVEVKIKWWSGIKKTLDELDGKLSNKTYTYSYGVVKDIKKGEALESWSKYKCEECQEERYGTALSKIDGKYICYQCERKGKEVKTKWTKSINKPVDSKGTRSIPLGKVTTTGRIGGDSKRLEAKDLGTGSMGKKQLNHRSYDQENDYCEECNKQIVDMDFDVVGEDIYCLECAEKLFVSGVPPDEDHILSTKTIKELSTEDIDKEIDRVMRELNIVIEDQEPNIVVEDQPAQEPDHEPEHDLDYMSK